MADGLKRYRLDKDANLASQFKNCEPLENLVRLPTHDSFDVMNSRRPIYAIRKQNWNERREVSITFFIVIEILIYNYHLCNFRFYQNYTNV